MKNRSNVVFVVTVLIFLILVIITKISYEKMQSGECSRLATAKWYANDEATVNTLGNLEITFKEDETFDVYMSDTQVSCISGKYTVVYKGLLYLKCEKSGFNPPKGWKCNKKAFFKYKIKDNMLSLRYKSVEGKFGMQGENAVKEEEQAKITDLHNMNFINKQAKMLVSFYAGDMYIYNINNVDEVFGSHKEVLGDVCFFGKYTQESEKNRIVAEAENEGDVKSNPMWPQMSELGEYEFKYRVEGDFKALVLQYEDKAYEFEKIEKE